MTTRNHYQDGEIIRTLRWTKADGTLYADAELRKLELTCAKIEDYEQAAKIRDELKRRNETLTYENQ